MAGQQRQYSWRNQFFLHPRAADPGGQQLPVSVFCHQCPGQHQQQHCNPQRFGGHDASDHRLGRQPGQQDSCLRLVFRTGRGIKHDDRGELFHQQRGRDAALGEIRSGRTNRGVDDPAVEFRRHLHALVINEFLAHMDDPEVDYIELFNYGATSFNLDGCILSDEPATNKFVIPANVVIPPRGFVYFTQSLTNSIRSTRTSPSPVTAEIISAQTGTS